MRKRWQFGLFLCSFIHEVLATANVCRSVRYRVDCAGNNFQESTWINKEQLCQERGCCWDADGDVPCFMPGDGSGGAVERVLLIQSSHLDIGYKSLVPDLINEYFDVFFPRAVDVGAQLRKESGPARLRWMTHPYLVSLFVDCPTGLGIHCPNASALANFSAAVRAGDIWWQAFPANNELALMDPSLIESAIDMTHALDDSFGVPRKRTVSSRDVPGMDRSIIPLLKKRGVMMITEGMNGSPWPVNMPPAFVWNDRAAVGTSGHNRRGILAPTGDSVLALWTLNYGDFGVSQRFPNSTTAVAYDWRGDNTGPPLSPQEVHDNWHQLAKLFPGAAIEAATFDDVAAELERVRDLLPVVGKESGDTWIFGCASDPEKLAHLRIVQRHRAACQTEQTLCVSEAQFANLTRLLTKSSEHTWGGSVYHYGDAQYKWYKNNEFHELRSESYANISNKSASFVKFFEDSWRDQRNFAIGAAIEAVAGSELETSIRDEISALKPVRPDVHKDNLIPLWSSARDGAKGVHPDSVDITLKGWITIAIDGSGAIVKADDLRHAASWAATTSPLASAKYRTMADGFGSELASFRAQYLFNDNWEYGKPNCNGTAGCLSSLTVGTVKDIWHDALNCSVFVRLEFSPMLHKDFGAPEEIWMNITASDSSEGSVAIDFAVFKKTATRMAEAGLLGFLPSGSGRWAMDKLGEWVLPDDVVDGGSKGLHGVSTGVNFLREDGSSLFIETVDAPIVSWGGPNPFPTPVHGNIDLSSGANFVLWDNLWNTNYIFWWPNDTPPGEPFTDFRYRFSLHFQGHSRASRIFI